MNIILADIRGLTLDSQAPAEIDSESLQRVPDGAGSSLDSLSAGSRQAFEFTMFFDQVSTRQSTRDEAVAAPPGDVWGEYLANAPVRVTTDGEPALLRPAAITATLRVTAPETGPGRPATSGPAGGSLPPGGNLLPGLAPPAVGAAGTAPVVEPRPMPADAAPSAARALIDAATQRPPAPAALEPVPRGEAQFDTTRATTAPARAVESLPAAPAAPAGAMRTAASAILFAGARPATPAPAIAPPAPPPTTAASAFEFVAANTPAQRPPPTVSAPPAPSVSSQESRATAAAETLAAPPRGHAAATESALAMSPRPAPAAAPLPTSGAVEMPLGDAFAAVNRGPEAAVTTLAAGGSAGAAPATQSTASPAANGAGLPPHLESLAIPRQAGAADWGNGLGERVSWMIDQRQNSATIRLDPPTLGKLDVQIRVTDDATTITIQAQHAPTRELIEASAMRLRDFLQESGFHNVNVDVSQRQDQQQARAQIAPDAHDGADGAAPEPDQSGATIADREAAGDGASLVDTFA